MGRNLAWEMTNNQDGSVTMKNLKDGGMKMKVYISGGITGCTGYYERFRRAEKYLREQGYIAINPAAVNGELPAETSYEQYMEMSMCMLSMADAIYMLDNWQSSCGANREYGYALGNGMKIMYETEV